MKILDLCCKEGGASAGYVAAGFEVVGVDLQPQPRYPYPFVRMDALAYVKKWAYMFDAIHVSPPCQWYSTTHRINRSDFPALIAPFRRLLEASGKPYVIENVVGAASELHDPTLLCGAMFGVETYRHRLFETNWVLTPPEHPEHTHPTTKMGRAPVSGEYMHIVGNFSGVAKAREIMNMPWASRDGLREAIPPAYSEFIGRQLLEVLS